MHISIKKEVMLAIGMFSLTIALLLDRFAGQEPFVDFFCGLFTGLSMIMNLGFLITYRLEKRIKFKV
ncbi:MAG: hypothetical protein ACXAEX_07125 [Promethearchaeota archaeon]|jgi:hypothetical protein